MSLAVVNIPEMALCMGKRDSCWLERVSGLLLFLLFFMNLKTMNLGDKLLLAYTLTATSAFQLNGCCCLTSCFRLPVYFSSKHFHNEKTSYQFFFL